MKRCLILTLVLCILGGCAFAEEERMVVPTDLNNTQNLAYLNKLTRNNVGDLYNTKDMPGQMHGAGLDFYSNDSSCEIVLNGKWQKLYGLMGPDTSMESRHAKNVTLTIGLDGQTVYTSAPVNIGDETVPVILDTTNADVMKLSVSASGKKSNIMLADAYVCNGTLPDNQLYGVSSFDPLLPPANAVQAADVPVAETHYAYVNKKGITDIRDNAYAYALELGSSQLHFAEGDMCKPYSYADYLTDGQYGSVSGTVVCDKGNKADLTMVLCIYADGLLVYRSSNITTRTKPVHFSADIAHADVVRIMAYYYCAYKLRLCVCDPVFGD